MIRTLGTLAMAAVVGIAGLDTTEPTMMVNSEARPDLLLAQLMQPVPADVVVDPQPTPAVPVQAPPTQISQVIRGGLQFDHWEYQDRTVQDRVPVYRRPVTTYETREEQYEVTEYVPQKVMKTRHVQVPTTSYEMVRGDVQPTTTQVVTAPPVTYQYQMPVQTFQMPTTTCCQPTFQTYQQPLCYDCQTGQPMTYANTYPSYSYPTMSYPTTYTTNVELPLPTDPTLPIDPGQLEIEPPRFPILSLLRCRRGRIKEDRGIQIQQRRCPEIVQRIPIGG